MRTFASSIIFPSSDTAPRPVGRARHRTPRRRAAHAPPRRRSALNTAFAVASCDGWMHCLPSNPIARAIRQARSKPARSLKAEYGPSMQRKPFARAARDDRVHHRVPAMSGIQLVVRVERPDARRRHAHRRRVVAGAEDQRFQSRRRLRDLAHPDEARRGLDLRLDADLLARTRDALRSATAASRRTRRRRATRPSAP